MGYRKDLQFDSKGKGMFIIIDQVNEQVGEIDMVDDSVTVYQGGLKLTYDDMTQITQFMYSRNIP